LQEELEMLKFDLEKQREKKIQFAQDGPRASEGKAKC